MVRETWVQSQVASYQRLLKRWFLIPPCLTLSYIRYVSRVKWSNPGKGVAPSPTPQFSSYWKGSLLVALDYARQLYFNRLIGQVVRVFANGPGDLGSITCRVIPMTFKMVHETSPTPRCSSYWKWSLLVTIDYGRQLYLLISYEYLKQCSSQKIISYRKITDSTVSKKKKTKQTKNKNSYTTTQKCKYTINAIP